MEVKISGDMPLPTPRSVICSPIHMMTVSTRTQGDDNQQDAVRRPGE